MQPGFPRLLRIGVFALALATGPARAADVVLHEGDSAVALARVGEVAGVAPETLRAATLHDLVATRPPMLQGGGRIEACDGAGTNNAEVAEAAAQAEHTMGFMEWERATEDLAAAYDTLRCLIEPVDPQTAARILFLDGVARFYAGDPEGADAAFRQAHRFMPGLHWDDNHPPDAEPACRRASEAVAASTPQEITVVPGVESTQVRVDGRLVSGTVEASPGAHLVQVGRDTVATVHLDLEGTAPATLLLPAALPEESLGWPADDRRGRALSEVLAGVLGPEQTVYAVYAGGVWRGTTGAAEWTELAPPDPALLDELAVVNEGTRSEGGAVTQTVNVYPAPPRRAGPSPCGASSCPARSPSSGVPASPATATPRARTS